MEKKYIIKDARNTLAHQLETTGITEKTPMSESLITNARGLSAGTFFPGSAAVPGSTGPEGRFCR